MVRIMASAIFVALGACHTVGQRTATPVTPAQASAPDRPETVGFSVGPVEALAQGKLDGGPPEPRGKTRPRPPLLAGPVVDVERLLHRIENLQKSMRYHLRPSATIVTARLEPSADESERRLRVGFRTETGPLLHDEYIVRNGRVINLFRALPDLESKVLAVYQELLALPVGYVWERAER